jgi:hypothetical protein
MSAIADVDHLRAAVIAAMAAQGITAYAVAKKSQGAVGEDAVRRFVAGRVSLGSDKLAAVCDVLGLRLTHAHKADDRESPKVAADKSYWSQVDEAEHAYWSQVANSGPNKIPRSAYPNE